jgi:RNA polymerase sigma-70 factor (ECF subfamily)
MHINNYVPNFMFSTWICEIAKNTLVNHKRKTNSKKTRFIVDFHKSNVYDPQDNSATAEEDLIRIDIAAKLARCINMLSPSYKRIIELRFYEELKYEEIAVELDIPLHTVKARLSRAKVDLRKKYLANKTQ